MVAKVALLINPARGYTQGLLSGIAQYARLHASWTLYRPLEYREPRAGRKLLPVLRTLKPDGILMREPAEMEDIIRMRVPIVCSPYTRESIPGVANIITDQEAVGRMAAEHLLDRGLRHLAYCGFDDWWWSCRRRDAFSGRIEQAGFATHVYKLPLAKSQRTWEKELPRIVQWLESVPKPVGIMTCNDDRGELVVEACKTAGLSVPDQVAVVGVDNDRLVCDLCSPSLSSVATSLQKTGYEAAALLDRMMRGQETGRPTLRIEPMYVVTRQSTDVLAVEDTEVATMLRFIRGHARANIGVKEVIAGIGLSRRILEKRFRCALGRSIHEEIQRIRRELLESMLIETQMPVADIAAALAFPDAAHASRFLRRETGVSPAQFRRRHRP